MVWTEDREDYDQDYAHFRESTQGVYLPGSAHNTRGSSRNSIKV